uniref:Transmembrane protein 231 n=1 Tax=Ascaris lumbricoides TaxID=6252 RepID=A0A0M3IMI4_ASCLU
MKYSVLHEEPYTRKYKASTCSAAFLCRTLTIIFALILPLVITFATQGMWKKYGEYGEQPSVQFKNRYIIMLKGASNDDYFLWSTYPVLNQAEHSRLRIPIIEATTADYNDDGKTDLISISATFFVSENEKIFGAFWMLLFEYRLDMRSRFSMETALVGDIDKLKPAYSLSITGDFNLEQSIPLQSFGWDLDHGGPLINESDPDFLHYAPIEIMLRNSLRNFTTTLKRDVIVWSSKSMEKNSFVIRFSIRIPEQKLTYKSGLLELLKFAWIQYLSIFVIFHFIFSKLLKFVFENRIVSSIVVEDQRLE